MSNNEDIRWLQRLNNYEKALTRMAKLVEVSHEDYFDDVYRDALIKCFEYTQALSWKVLKDFYEDQGESAIQGSKDAYQLAFQRGLISDGQVFLDSIKSRDSAAHCYDEERAKTVCNDIIEKYYDAFEQLRVAMLKEKETRNL